MRSSSSFVWLAVALQACAIESSGLRDDARDAAGHDAARIDAARVDARAIDSGRRADASTPDTGCPGCDAGFDGGCAATGTCPECTIHSDCGAPTVGDWTACTPDTECAQAGNRTRARTEHTCRAGACESDVIVETERCTARTDGDTCTGDGLACTIDECAGGDCTHRCDGMSICTCNPGLGCACI